MFTVKVAEHLLLTILTLTVQSLSVRVNRKHVELPYRKEGVFSAVREGPSVVISTSVGIRLIWDGDSYLEVGVKHLPLNFCFKVDC